jgi:Zn-dependent peptidase ImmA (M78 family)
MTELIERNGGVVIACDFGSGLIDAMSQRIDGLPILFFINAHSPSDRVRHTLAHELGHMVLHTLAFSEDENMEREADAFAGAFLVPAGEYRSQLRSFDLRQLANLKAYWKVSMKALAYRAGQLNLVTPYQQKRVYMELNSLGYARHEPGEPPAEPPKALDDMIAVHKYKLNYSDDELAALLDLEPDEFRRMYPASNKSAPSLRLIKK